MYDKASRPIAQTIPAAVRSKMVFGGSIIWIVSSNLAGVLEVRRLCFLYIVYVVACATR